MTKNGCHNRAPLRETAVVQKGWEEQPYNFVAFTRMPLMAEIPDPMSKACIYGRDKKDDPKCANCIWKDVPPSDTLNAGSF